MQTSKKTYNLSLATIRSVQALAHKGTFATTQDGVVERAVADLARQARDLEHQALWANASSDPEFQAEAGDLEREFEPEDRAAWELQ